MRFRRGLTAAVCIVLAAGATSTMSQASGKGAAPAVAASVPRPGHVVIVVEENHAQTEIVGSPDAPFISSLASENANFTQSYGETHPSKPNYLALFSGSTQGLTDDSRPHTYSAPNLGAGLGAAGLGFVGYSDGLPAAGYTGCASGNYARKHNPGVNFRSVPSSANQPITAFPTDYSTLHEVSVVVPDLHNDMHDGAVAQGDTWLQNNLGGYVSWAKAHNSLFVLTFDEDDNSAANRIPTVFAGQRVVPGSYPEVINHYNVLRTITDAYGLPGIGNAATASPITDVWSPANGNQPPSAAFAASCSQLSCAFDGSGSSDPDGSVTSYAWDFGDGASGSGLSPSHVYAAGGSYDVRLTVTDDQGLPGSVTPALSVTAPAGTPFVSDSFNRTVASGLGSAEVGGTWSVSTAAPFSVAPGVGSVRLAAASRVSAYLGSVVRTDADVTVRFGVDRVPVGGPEYVTVQGRRISAGNYYSARLLLNANRSVTLWVTRVVNGAETALSAQVTVPGVTFSAGSELSLRLQVSGTAPTLVRARVWPDGGWSRRRGWSVPLIPRRHCRSTVASGSSTTCPGPRPIRRCRAADVR